MEYREERKYFCSDYQLEILKHRLKAILPYDVHQKDSSYTISSLYFDTADNQCYYENSAGVDDRKKYRIRIYDHSDSNIRFEIKEKLRGKTKKSAVPITRSQCEDLIAGHFLPAVSAPCRHRRIRAYCVYLSDRKCTYYIRPEYFRNRRSIGFLFGTKCPHPCPAHT